MRWIGFTVLPWAAFSLNFAVVGAAFIFSIKKFVENPAGVAFVLSLPGFLAIIIAPFSSFLSDRIWTRFGRRKPFVIWGGIGMIVALMAMPLAPNFWMLVAAYILYHICDGLSAPREPLKQEIVPPHERGRATGAMAWCQNLAIVIFYSVMLGRFDDVTYLAGLPLHGETVIYWSAALLLTVMILLIVLGIKEIDPKSSLVGQRLSPANIVRSLFDRELWPVYLLVLSHGLLNFFSGFGPFLTTLLYTDQWNYSKQEMGINVAIGGIVNIFIIGFLTLIADRLPRMRALRTLIALSLLWNAFYYCYVNFILPDKRPSLVEIILFGEGLCILSILAGLVYTPLIYDYVRRNKMGTFAAGMQITTRGTHLFTLNGIGIFVWAYAALFQPPAGEMTRVVLREETDKTSLLQTLRAHSWSFPHDQTAAPPSAITADYWQADGVSAESGQAWEIRLRNKASEELAREKLELEKTRSPLLAEYKRLADVSAAAAQKGDAEKAARVRETSESKRVESEQLTLRIATLEGELAARAASLRGQIAAALGPDLIAEGEQISRAALAPVLILELATTTRPEGKSLERILDDVRRELPAFLDLRPLKRDSGYGLSASALIEANAAPDALIQQMNTAIASAAARRAPGLLGPEFVNLGHRLDLAFTMDLHVVEEPVPAYVSPVTRTVNGILGLFDRAPSPTRKIDAVARNLRIPGKTAHVRVAAPRNAERIISIAAIIEPSSDSASSADDPLGQRLRLLLGGDADDDTLRRARAFYDRVEKVAAAQRVTVARQFLTTGYVPLKYDYMSGYIWVLGVGVIGLLLTFVFGRIEARGGIQKRGVEEAQAS